jgi:Protein of unknown function (DUF1579)
MRFKSIVIATLCIAMFGVSASAKDKKSKKEMDPQEMMETYKKLGQPGEAHKQLVSLGGSWTIQTKEWMEPNKPPMESTGTADFKVLFDGRFVQQEYASQMHGQPYSGLGTHGYDNLTKKYVTSWVDSMGTGIFTMDGTASPDGKTITLKGSHLEPGGGVMKHRAIWKFPDANTQTFEMYGTHGNGKEMKVMEITYTRKQ